MAYEDIPLNIRAFIARYVRSVSHIEAVLLFGDDPSRPWSAEEVGRELRTNTSLAASQLQLLSQGGVIREVAAATPDKPAKYCLSSESEVLLVVQQLRELYNTRRPSIINLIYSQPLEKIRDLADAFVFGKKE